MASCNLNKSEKFVTNITEPSKYIPYARHYKPRLISFFTQFSLQLQLILQTISVLKTEILHFLSLKSAAYKREWLQIESGLWWRVYGSICNGQICPYLAQKFKSGVHYTNGLPLELPFEILWFKSFNRLFLGLLLSNEVKTGILLTQAQKTIILQ